MIKHKPSNNKPKNYYRCNIPEREFGLAMKDRGWLKVFQVAALIGDKIPPESKARFAELHNRNKHKQHSLEQTILIGLRDFTRLKLYHLFSEGKVEKNGSGKDAEYRWKSEVNTTGQDKAGRRHAVEKIAE